MAKVLKGVEKVSGRDFSLVDEAGHVPSRVGSFYSATYGPQKIPVTLLLRSSQDETLWSSRSAFSLCPVTKFTDNDGGLGLISQAGKLTYALKISCDKWLDHYNSIDQKLWLLVSPQLTPTEMACLG